MDPRVSETFLTHCFWSQPERLSEPQWLSVVNLPLAHIGAFMESGVR